MLNVIDLQEPDLGIQIWDASYFAFAKRLKERLIDEADEVLNGFPDLEEGLTLVLIVKMHKFIPNYYEVTDIKFKRRKNQYTEKDAQSAPKLDRLLG